LDLVDANIISGGALSLVGSSESGQLGGAPSPVCFLSAAADAQMQDAIVELRR